MRGRCSAAIPQPVSLTSIFQACPVAFGYADARSYRRAAARFSAFETGC